MNKLSVSEINRAVDNAKDQFRSLDKTRKLFYEFSVIMASNPSQAVTYGGGSNESGKGSAYDDFCSSLENLLSNEDVAYITVRWWDTNGTKKSNPGQINIAIQSTRAGQPIMMPQQQAQEQPAKVEPQVQIPVKGNSLGAVLNLLGLGGENLAGVDDDIAGIGAVLAVRDKMTEQKYESKEQQRQIGELSQKNLQLRDELDKVKDELAKAEKKIERLEDKNYELEEEATKLRKMKGMAGMAGVVGAELLTNFAKKHAGGLGSVIGANRGVVLGLIDAIVNNEEDEAAEMEALEQPMAQASVAPATDIAPASVSLAGEENADFARIKTFLMDLTPEESQQMFSIIIYLDENRDKISSFATAVEKLKE